MSRGRGYRAKVLAATASGVLCLACWQCSTHLSSHVVVDAFSLAPSYSKSATSSSPALARGLSSWIAHDRGGTDLSLLSKRASSSRSSGCASGISNSVRVNSRRLTVKTTRLCMMGAAATAAGDFLDDLDIPYDGVTATEAAQYQRRRRRRELPQIVAAMGVLSPKALTQRKAKKEKKRQQQQQQQQPQQSQDQRLNEGEEESTQFHHYDQPPSAAGGALAATASGAGTTSSSSTATTTSDDSNDVNNEQIYFSEDLREMESSPPLRLSLDVSLDSPVMPAPLNPCLITASMFVLVLGSIAILSRITLMWRAIASYASDVLSQVAYTLGLSDALEAVQYRCRLIGGSLEAWYEGVRSAWEKAFGPEEVRLPVNDWSICVLDERVKMGDKFMRYRFRYQASNYVLPLELGQEIMLCGLDDNNGNNNGGQVVHASFQPLSSRHSMGYFDIVVQRDAGYLSQGPGKGAQAQFVRLLDTLAIGDELAVKPGRSCLQYRGPYSPITDIVMVATGLGIVPMLQMIDELLPSRESSVHSTSVIWLNEHAEDFALYDKLEKAFYKHHRKLDVSCVIERDLYGHNIASNPKVCEAIPDFKIGTMAVISGPDYFARKVQDYLERQGYPEEVLVAF